MAIRITPPSTIKRFSFSSVPSQGPDDVLENVKELLAAGNIEKAESIYESALVEGVFSDALGTSFESWSSDADDKIAIKKTIESAIAAAKKRLAAVSERAAESPELQINPQNKA